MKKLIAVLLITVLIIGIFCSCGNKDNINKNNGNTTVADNETDAKTNNTNITEPRIESNLPEMDFDGYNFVFLTHGGETIDWANSNPIEIVAEEENANPIIDAVYKRNLKIKQKYNINIEMIADGNEIGLLSKAVKNGERLYDAVLIYNNNVSQAITSGNLTNISNLPYIDLNKPWWDPAVKALSIDNKNYLLGGDMLILDNEATNALIFNKILMLELGIEAPYNLVVEGKWTMDAMNNIIKNTAKDLNGDGKMTGLDDRWGFGIFKDTLHALLVSGGGALAVKNENDIPYMDFTSEKNLNILEKAMDLMYNPEYVFNLQNLGDNVKFIPFAENKMLFLWIRMRVIDMFKGMESNFGIVPMPKVDESQEKYYSLVNPYTGVLIGVPKNAEDLERVSIILEAFAIESRHTLQPAYYDVILQRKYVRDDESSEMLDIIFSSRVYDIGGIYNFGSVFNGFLDLAGARNRDVKAYYDKRIEAMNKAINKVVETFQSME